MANVFGKEGVRSVNGKRGKVTVREDKNFVFVQSDSLSVWEIYHPLDKKCSITVTDTAGTIIEGNIIINNGSKVTIEFNFPFSGEAVLN